MHFLREKKKKKEKKEIQPLYFALHRPLVKLSTAHYSSALGERHISCFHFGRDTPSHVTLFLLLNLGRGPSRTAAAAGRPKKKRRKKKKRKKEGRHISGHPGDLRAQLCPCGDLARCHPDVGRGALAAMTKRLAAGRTLPHSNFHHWPHYTHTHGIASTSSGKSIRPQAGGL